MKKGVIIVNLIGPVTPDRKAKPTPTRGVGACQNKLNWEGICKMTLKFYPLSLVEEVWVENRDGELCYNKLMPEEEEKITPTEKPRLVIKETIVVGPGEEGSGYAHAIFQPTDEERNQ